MVQQKYLSKTTMILFITFMNMSAPIAVDIYSPALPEMGKYFSASEFLASLTLTVFFFFFAIGMILFGPFSDKYGRKPVLIFGSVIYTVASFACAFSPNIYFLTVGRFFQGLGAGAMVTVSTALMKDCFQGKLLTKILAITQALGVIAPMAAPLLGGFLLRFTSWQGAFYVLTFLGLINILLACLLSETLTEEKRYTGKILHSLSLLVEVGKNTQFMLILIMFSFLSAPYMAYVSVSPFIYVDHFSLTPQECSYFFAANAAAALIGPMLYLKFKNFLSNKKITEIIFGGCLVSTLLVLVPGHLNPFAFLFSFLPFTILRTAMRPFRVDILLNKVKENAGAASSLITFTPTLIGSLGMMLGTVDWGDFIFGLGMIMAGSILISFSIFKFAVKGL